MMKNPELKRALASATKAARTAGALMRKNLHLVKKINEEHQHDIKLELDVRCQKVIEKQLLRDFPASAILGEEGVSGSATASARWVVDPIDGTVNYAHGLPHACVSIALQVRADQPARDCFDGVFRSVVGVVYDPFTDEMFTAIAGQPARLNGRIIKVSQRAKLEQSVVSLGFSKSKRVLEQMLPAFARLTNRVRKIRIMGAAALSLVYVAAGRMDAYVESSLRLWDIAAGGLILECAGGEFLREPIKADHYYRMVASNGLVGRKMARLL
jgi:myo-inositol-1(or 4)-monophosphatase